MSTTSISNTNSTPTAIPGLLHKAFSSRSVEDIKDYILRHSPTSSHLNYLMRHCAGEGDEQSLTAVKYILSLKNEGVDIESCDQWVARCFLTSGNLAAVSFLIENKYLNINSSSHSFFLSALKSPNKMQVIKYLIFDANIELTPAIKKTIESKQSLHQVMQIFTSRQEIKKLNAAVGYDFQDSQDTVKFKI